MFLFQTSTFTKSGTVDLYIIYHTKKLSFVQNKNVFVGQLVASALGLCPRTVQRRSTPASVSSKRAHYALVADLQKNLPVPLNKQTTKISQKVL